MFDDISRPILMHPPFNDTGAEIAQTLRLGGHSSGNYSSFNLASHVGDSEAAISANWLALAEATGGRWTRETLATCTQVHGEEIEEVVRGGHQGFEADALISRQVGVGVGVFTADCVPVILVDRKAKAVAAAHCGWRGATLELASKTLSALLIGSNSHLSDVEVWLGAGIAAANYEVGKEVASCFDESYYQPSKDQKYLLDVSAAIEGELLAFGLTKEQVQRNRRDTFAEAQLFYSYRRDGKATGRMLTFVGYSAG